MFFFVVEKLGFLPTLGLDPGIAGLQLAMMLSILETYGRLFHVLLFLFYYKQIRKIQFCFMLVCVVRNLQIISTTEVLLTILETTDVRQCP